MRRFRFDDDGDVAEDIRTKFGFDGDLLDYFTENQGPVVHKWHHYIPIYDRYFSRFRGTKLKFLEIGVHFGGSMQMWRKYFGDDAVIYGIDIDKDCARFDGEAGQVRIGSQADPDFLNQVVDEMGGVDVILDDGSHHMNHIPVSLQTLFPRMSEGGVYMIEDLHTAYLEKFGGGIERQGNFFNTVRGVMDDMHRWYHRTKPLKTDYGKQVSGMHVHDSIVVLDKDPVHRPVHSRVGTQRAMAAE